MSLLTAERPASSDCFTPKLVTLLRQGYDLARLRRDAVAGLTVAVVALPLSMAIAIASGVGPERGLFTAIVGGFLVSALGGSRFQIGGPAGAFIVLVAGTVREHGVDGLLVATMMAGAMLIAIGALRLGAYVRYVPYPVTIGFTAGIAVIIFASQLRDLFGLALAHEPGPILPKLAALAAVAGSWNPATLAVSAAVVALIVVLRRYAPRWPGLLIAVTLASLAAAALALPVETIGTRFGGIPRTLPLPALPALSLAKAAEVWPAALAFTLLGAIETLLSAVVADAMGGGRHRSNMELVAQGVANIASALFSGICVTGAIARTATNVRSGASGPVAGMLHAVFLAAFMVLAAPLAAYIPLAALAGVLAVVAWNMVEKPAIAALWRASRADSLVAFVTFALVVFRDLTEGIVVGFALGALMFIARMSRAVGVEERAAEESETVESPTGPIVYHLSGALFFGAAATVGAMLDQIAERKRPVVLDVSAVPLLDSTAATLIENALRKAAKAHLPFLIAGAAPPIRHMLRAHGVRPPEARYFANVESAMQALAPPEAG